MDYNVLYSQEFLYKLCKIVKTTYFMGIGNSFRQISQAFIMKRWELKYGIKSAIEVPYDQATMGIDGVIFNFKAYAKRSFEGLKPNSYDLVWNFGFLQRHPSLIYDMIRISRHYVAAFVPNSLNSGAIVHSLYHKIYKKPCLHPERGCTALMNLRGLIKLFEDVDLRIIESGYIDIPPWPDTVVTIKELLGYERRNTMKIPFLNFKKLLALMSIEKILVPKFIFAHHSYVLGEKR